MLEYMCPHCEEEYPKKGKCDLCGQDLQEMESMEKVEQEFEF